MRILEIAVCVLEIGQQAFSCCVLDRHGSFIRHEHIMRRFLRRCEGVPAVVQAERGRDGLLARIRAVRSEMIAAGAVHDTLTVDPVDVAARPRPDFLAVRENVRQAVVYVIFDVLVQRAQTVQHARRLLPGNVLIRGEFAVSDAVYHACRGAEQHIRVIGIGEADLAGRGSLQDVFPVPRAVDRSGKRAEILAGDRRVESAVHLRGYETGRTRRVNRLLRPRARRVRRTCCGHHCRREQRGNPHFLHEKLLLFIKYHFLRFQYNPAAPFCQSRKDFPLHYLGCYSERKSSLIG